MRQEREEREAKEAKAAAATAAAAAEEEEEVERSRDTIYQQQHISRVAAAARVGRSLLLLVPKRLDNGQCGSDGSNIRLAREHLDVLERHPTRILRSRHPELGGLGQGESAKSL